MAFFKDSVSELFIAVPDEAKNQLSRSGRTTPSRSSLRQSLTPTKLPCSFPAARSPASSVPAVTSLMPRSGPSSERLSTGPPTTMPFALNCSSSRPAVPE